MTAFLMTLLRTIGVSLLTKKFGIWLAKVAAKSTKNMIDDNAVNLIEGGLNNDTAAIEAAAKAIIEEIQKDLMKDKAP